MGVEEPLDSVAELVLFDQVQEHVLLEPAHVAHIGAQFAQAASQVNPADSEKQIRRIEGIISSMTPAERAKPELIKASRKRRIATGAGVPVQEVNRMLHKTFITPIDREQIHSLINTMDDVVDLIQDSAETMALYDVRHMTEEITRLTDLSVKCCERLKHAVSLMDKLNEPKTAEAALKTCEEIDRLESDADRVMRTAMSKLFREEPDVREVIKLKAIYELLETITDKCEDVANEIEGIVLENA